MTASELTELAARVEAGSGEDRRLYDDIALALGWQYIKDGFHVPYWMRPGGTPQDGAIRPSWLTSLDAVVALIAERLPGIGGNTHGYEVSPVECSAYVSRNNVKSGHWMHQSDAKTPTQALLAALLKALAAQQQDRQTEGE